MSITNKGSDWEFRHSLWIIWSFFALSFVAFLIIGRAAKKKLWVYYGLGYFILFIIWMALTESDPESTVYDIGATSGVFVLFGGIVHSFMVRTEYLRRLAVITDESSQSDAMEATRRQMLKERGIASSDERVAAAHEKLRQRAQEYQEHPQQAAAAATAAAKPVRPAERHSKPAESIDINACSLNELAGLPGVSMVMAKKAIDYRSENGGFKTVDEFFEVMQLKPHFVVQVQDMLTCEPLQQQTATTTDAPTGRKLDL